MDPRIEKHARIIVDYSTKVREGDNLLITYSDFGKPLAIEVYKLAASKGASPLIITTPTEAVRGYFEVTPERFLEVFPQHYYELVKASDVVVSIRGEETTRYLSTTEPEKISQRSRTTKPISDEYLEKRWCLTQYPSPSYAQEAEMSLHEYEDFTYSAVLRNWEQEAHAMKRLKDVLDAGKEVRIVGERTDLSLAIEGRVAVISDGTQNLPGGEVYTSPLEDSAQGEVYFDVPSVAYGKEVRDIWLRFEDGEIADSSAGKNEDLLKTMIETDSGSKRLGELGIGTNRGIDRYTRNILFDEKMAETIHLAIGRAFKNCKGVNESSIHWDMIKRLVPGEIRVDGHVIQKDGRFTWE